MKLMLVQLSDIHLKAAAEKNPILRRANHVANAILGVPDDVTGCIIAISGDVAYSGKATEYAHATKLFNGILAPIVDRFKADNVLLVLVPGNHDCDFELEESTRPLILEKLSPEKLVDEAPIRLCMQVQEGYRQFARNLASQFPSLQQAFLVEFSQSMSLRVANQTVTFHLFNSAWCSKKREVQSELYFPIDLWKLPSGDAADPELAVSVIHHPYNWFKADNARNIRTILERHSDLILTGHEHHAGAYRKENVTGEQNEYLEGGVLQDNDDDNNSSFYVAVIDTEMQAQSTFVFTWNTNLYKSECVSEDRPFQRNKARLTASFPYTDHFRSRLSDPGAGFKHPRKDELSLFDVYVYPDLKEITRDDIEEAAYIKSDDAVNRIVRFERVFVIGGDASGKTSFAKKLVGDLHSRGFVPLFIDGGEFQVAKPEKFGQAIERSIAQQFGEPQVQAFEQLQKTQRAVIIDDYHLLHLNERAKSAFLEHLFNRFQVVIVLAGDESRFEEFTRDEGDRAALIQMKHLEIMELGYKLRSQLIRKWHSIGQELSASREELDDKVRKSESQINILLGEHFMPAHPIIVLVALQQLEIQESVVGSVGSIGHLYAFLIKERLITSINKHSSADTNENYLSELAWHLFEEGIARISDHDARRWHGSYCKTYRLTLDFEKQWAALIKAELIEEHGGATSFKYPYINYYFVANYLARHSTEQSIRDRIKVLTTNLHQPHVANIVLFLCHLSKDPEILASIMETADKLFVDYQPCDLDKDVEFLNERMGELKSLSLDDNEPENRRQDLLDDADKVNQKQVLSKKGPGESREIAVSKVIHACDMRELNDQLKLNSALKTIQIIGQILRNHVGSLTGETKRALVLKCYYLGLRAAKCLFTVLEENIDDLVIALIDALQRKQGAVPKAKRETGTATVSKEQLRHKINQSVWGTLELGTFAIIKYISDSVGTEQLSETFADVLEEESTIPIELIDLAVKLDHYRSFPEQEVKKLAISLHKNLFTFSVLRDLVWTRFYLYPVNFKTRQSISEKLKISTKRQQRIIGLHEPKNNRLGYRERDRR